MVRSVKRKHDTEKPTLHRKKKPSVGREFPICKLLSEHGLLVATNAIERNQIEFDQFTFQQNVEKALRKYSKKDIKQLTDSLEQFWQDGTSFCLSLLPTDSSDTCTYSSRGKQQESLARLLLGIEKLQNPVADILLEKIPEVSFNENLTKAAKELGDLNLVHRIVCQIRWLDCVYNRKELLKKITDVISVSELATQQELICCLSEVVDDENKDEVAGKLQQMLIENSELVSCVLDALNNINLKGDLLTQIRESVLKIIQSVNVSELPTILKFLQNSARECDAFDLIKDIRSKLQLGSNLGSPRYSSTPHQRISLQQDNNKQIEVLIFETFRGGIRFNRMLGDAWTKVLDSIKIEKNQKIIDVFALVTLYSLKHKRKSLNTLLRNKIKAGIFTEENVSAAFNSNPEVYHDCLKEILLMSEILLRAADGSVSSYGGHMYEEIFCCFDVYSQQEVVASLVTHIGSGYEHEVEAAFAVLRRLVEKNPAKMVTFVVILKGTLDYLENLSLSQLRCLIGMVSRLTSEVNRTSIDDDLMMVVRKQLSSMNVKYKRIGVVGGLAILANFFDVQQSSLQNTTNDNGELLEGEFQQVVNILKMIASNVKNSNGATSLFYDELTLVIKHRNLNKRILVWISETIVGDFEDKYLMDSSEVKDSNNEYRNLVYDLDEPQEGGIAVDISPPQAEQSSGDGSGSKTNAFDKWNRKMVMLPAQFRLISQCEKKLNAGNLDAIDALLGCPLVFYSEKTLENVWTTDEEEIRHHCIVVCHAINWFRELLNCFSKENAETDEKGKIITRLKTMVTLSEHLEKVLAITKTVELPLIDFSIEDNLLETVHLGGNSSKEGAAKRNRKSPKQTDIVNDEGEGSSISEENEEVSKKQEKSCDNTIPLLKFPASFRQLDLCVLYSLSYKAVSKTSNQSDVNEEVREEIKMAPGHINFLLADLLRKLEYSLSGGKNMFLKRSSAKTIGFSNLPRDLDVIKFMVMIMETLCHHYKSCTEYFDKLHEEYEEVVEGNRMFSEECQEISTMFICLLKCYTLLLQWEGFYHGKNSKLLRELLSVLAKNLSPGNDGNGGTQELIKVVFNSFLLKDWIPTKIDIAINTYKLLSSVAILTQDSKQYFREQKEELVLKFLKQTWFESSGEKEKGAKFNESLNSLIRCYIKETADPLEAMSELCDGLNSHMTKCKEKGVHSDETFPSLTKHSMIAYYRALFEELVGYVKTQSLSPPIENNFEMIAEKLPSIHKVLLVFQSLNALLKAVDNNRLFLMASLKYSKLFLEWFLKSTMPLLDLTLRTHKDMVHNILRTAQQSTRSLQHLCGHSKVSKDVLLTTHVPNLKKCLEMFVFRVKAVLAHNNCDSVFWLGNLKNRDLQGNEIASQRVPVNGNEEEDEEDSNTVDLEQNDEYSESF